MKIFCVYPASKECIKVYRNELPGIRTFLKSLFDATELSGDTLKIITDGNGLRDLKAAGIANECIISGRIDDIWIRDFGLVNRASSGDLTCFTYAPKSLTMQEANWIQETLLKWTKHVETIGRINQSRLIVDGGNIVLDPVSKRAVVTERIFSDNKNMDREEIYHQLSKDLNLNGDQNLCIIAEDPDEGILGHADGSAAFVSENDIVINCENENNKEYNNALRQKIQQTFSGINIHTLPYSPEDKVYRTPGTGVEFYSSKGVYVNLLRTGNAIYVPQYGLDEDEIALSTLKRIVKQSTKVIGVDASGIAHMGGSVRCLTMTLND